MPNHYLTMLTCTTDYERVEAELEKDDNWVSSEDVVERARKIIQEDKFNFCTEAHPRPAEYDGTISPCPESQEELQEELYEKYGAHNWYDWCNINWGTKWGTYGHRIEYLGGDGGVIMLAFQSAWGPPNELCMNKIVEYIKKELYLNVKMIHGHDPYDGSCRVFDNITLPVEC